MSGEGITRRIASFQRAEVVTGLVVALGSIVVAIPGRVERLPTASALLLLPIAAFVMYGLLVLTGRPRRRNRSAPLALDERRLLRRRIITWSLVSIVASALPAEWVWAVFLGGWITLVYAVHQMRRLHARS